MQKANNNLKPKAEAVKGDKDVEELQRKFEIVQAQKERLERIQQQLERELALKGSNEFVLSTKVETLNQDLIALRLTFAGELDRIRRDFRNELACMEARLSTKVDRKAAPSSSLNDVKLSPATANAFASSSWFWNGGDTADADCAPSAYVPPSPIHPPQQVQPNVKFATEQEASTSSRPQQQLSDKSQASHRLVPVKQRENQPEEITKADLVALASRVLETHGSLPIGKMGSLLHKAANNHMIPSILKERYGGLKKFLTSNPEFTLDTDHPYNPHVRLTSSLQNSPAAAVTVAMTSNVASKVAPATSTTDDLEPLVRRRSRGAPPGLDAPHDFEKESAKPVRSKLDIIDPESYSNMTPILALDCDLVGTGPGGKTDRCLRCTIVNFNGMVVYDALVECSEPVTDWRGLKEKLYNSSKEVPSGKPLPLEAVSKSVERIIKGRIVIGHSLVTDLRSLNLTHPFTLMRDTTNQSPFCPAGHAGRELSLSKLVMERLGINFQANVQPSTDAARAVLALYKSVHREWESLMRDSSEKTTKPSACTEDDFGNFSLFC